MGGRTANRGCAASRGKTFESRANCEAGMALAFSRRRIRLATLLASIKPVHAQPQAELVAVFARAEVSPGADREAAERLSAELAGATVHFGSIIGGIYC